MRRNQESKEDTVVVGNPNVPSYHSRVDAKKYCVMKNVLSKVFSNKKPGINQSEMMESVGSIAPKDVFPGKTYMWWAKCVQLDMESKMSWFGTRPQSRCAGSWLDDGSYSVDP